MLNYNPNPLRASYPELGNRTAMEALQSPAIPGAAAGLPVFTGPGGVAEAKTAEEARAALGLAPALQADVTIYVSPTGSDAEGDGSQAAPYATIQRAVDSVPKYLNAHTATINIADGEYDEAVNILGYTAGKLFLHGGTVNGTIIRNIVVSCSGIVQIDKCTLKQIGTESVQASALLYVGEGSNVMLENMTIDCSDGYHGLFISRSRVSALGASSLTVNNVNFKNGRCVYATNGASVSLYKITGMNATDIISWGICSEYGSTVSYFENTLTANTAHRCVYGGRIYAGGQMNIPNY